MKITKSNYEVGDIVFVSKYVYDNGKMGQNHLFVIIDNEKNGMVPIEYFGLIVSSNIYKTKYRYNELLKKNENNGLDIDSIVKCDVLYSILPKNILFKIGTVDVDDFMRFINSFSIKMNENIKNN